MNELNYQDGFDITISNSKKLFEAAELVYQNEQYGLACSLNILAAEEAIKTIFILFKILDPNIEVPDFEKMFRNHTFKHDNIKKMMTIYDLHMHRILKMIEPFKNLVSIAKKLPNSPKKDLVISDIESIEKVQIALDKYFNKIITLEELITWISSANNDKNNGLYVGFDVNNTWLNPAKFDAEKFLKEKLFTEEIISMAEQFEFIIQQVKKGFNN